MTTRFSLAELAEMLQVPVDAVRMAVDDLAEHNGLTAESFVYGERNWRIAPSDVKRVQDWIQAKQKSGELELERKSRRVVRRQVVNHEPV
jgi:hypothetical protein